ncbi:MAG TPA: 3-keto-5-aminohexanoate cleavage protein [Chlorobaculum sp.]|nr:3-keto-5-aminohexanoate cleavage protein [Chlorobaculum sp.]
MNTLQTSEFIVNLAPTGMVPTRKSSASVPLQPDEIVADVLSCAETGMTSVHLHARDENGFPTHRKDIYARIIGGIRDKRPDLVIGVSCSGRLGATLEQRSEVLTLEGDLRPDMASLTLSSLNFPGSASINSPETVKSLAYEMRSRGIKPEFEIFDLGMASVLRYLVERNLVDPPFYANLMLGNLASAQANFLDIGCLSAALPPDTTYCFGGIGRFQIAVAGLAVAAAPGVRIGLEDNLWLDSNQSVPASNTSLIRKVHALAAIHERKIMTPNELRRRINLRSFL